jgi:hypothetical protein
LAKYSDITKDPRYLEFVDRYHGQLIKYVMENSRFTPTWQQLDVLEDIEKKRSRVAISSGHGTGKSHIAAWVLDHNLRAHPFSNSVLSASNIVQATAVTFKYISYVMEDVETNFPWMRGHFVKLAKSYYVKNHKSTWFCIPRTASRDKPESLSGMHNPYLLYFADEASAITDPALDIMEAALTEPFNRMLMASQPTRPTGRFAEAMTSNSKAKNGTWASHTLNSEESPLVTREYIRDLIRKYGGAHSPEYMIKVNGCLPDCLEGFLIPRSWADDCQHFKINHTEDWGWVITVDVSEGVHRDSSVMTVGKVSGYGPERSVETISCEEYLDLDEKQFARVVAAKYRSLPAATVAVDADGAGRTVVLDLEEMGIPVERIHWGLPPHTDADKKRYLNQRAFAQYKLREGILEERFKGPVNSKFVEQASKLPYKIDEQGRYRMMPKEQMKSEGIKSPDISDTCSFFYLVDYIPSSGRDTAGEHTEEDRLLREAMEMMEDA